MKISVICSEKQHPVYKKLQDWVNTHVDMHEIELVNEVESLHGGDMLFLVSCHDYLPGRVRNQYTYSLLLHASDLPAGRGWSPHIWAIIQGSSEIVVTLLEVAEKIDSGKIWKKQRIKLHGHELYNEINELVFDTELSLMDYAINNFASINPVEQDEQNATFYPRRTPADSQIDVEKSIAEQFDILRTADPERYPAYFNYRGYQYTIKIEKKSANGDKGPGD